MKKVVISLGGSVFYHKRFNYSYLEKFAKLLSLYNCQFYVVIGGGFLARERILSCKGSSRDKDLAGISAINDNCLRVSSIFVNYFPLKFVEDFNDVSGKVNFVVGAKFVGRSSDWNSVKVAEKVGASLVLNLSNIDFIYDKDPSKFKSAKKILDISWNDYFSVIGKRRVPGGHYPFDPVASKLASKLGLSVYFVNGKKLDLVEKFFEGELVGSVIEG